MKLLRENILEVELLEEEKNNKKFFYLEGVFLQSTIKNKNGRIYPLDVLRNAVGSYNENFVKKNIAYGELSHPDTPTIDLNNVSHRIVSLKEHGTDFIGKALLSENPKGMIVRNLMKEGGVVGVSSRGLGSLKTTNEGNIVSDDYYICTAADCVANPSAPDAFVRGIMENADWVYLDGKGWVPEYIDTSRKQIKQASSKQLEEMAIHIFSNFLKRL